MSFIGNLNLSSLSSRKDLATVVMCLLSGLLNWFKLVDGPLGRAACTVHSISAQTSQEGIECTTAKEQVRAYCLNIYTVSLWYVFVVLRSAVILM